MSETPVPAPAPERNILAKIFLSPDEHRLRAGWRLIVHVILLIVIGVISVILISSVVGLLTSLNVLIDPQVAGSVANVLVNLFAFTGATLLARKFIDRRSITSLGLKLDILVLYDLLAGILIAGILMGVIFLVMLAAGWTRVEGFSWQVESPVAVAGGLLLWLAIFVVVGWQEELLSRGYHLQNITEGMNLFWGVLISSSVFALLHLANNGATAMSTLGIFLAGLFLALPYLLTRQLWLSIGLHIGWNFFEGVVFGFPVSGIDTYRLLRQTVSGPEIWTGGIFGPEAGLVVVPALLFGALLVYLYTRPPIRQALSGPAKPTLS